MQKWNNCNLGPWNKDSCGLQNFKLDNEGIPQLELQDPYYFYYSEAFNLHVGHCELQERLKHTKSSVLSSAY